jgi:hypothetical protein
MAQQWFYAHEGHRHGPCTAQELRDLAVAGKILGSDTVWKDGVDQGVSAHRVKNLFPDSLVAPSGDAAPAGNPPAPEQQPPAEGESVSAQPAAEASAPSEQAAPGPETAAAPLPDQPAAASYQSNFIRKPIQKARAIALRGAKIFAQDGTTVQFKKVCTKCGYEDPSRATMTIRTGISRVPFFCPKCKKPREVSIQGTI